MEPKTSGLPGPAQLRLFAIIFAVSVSVLAIGYYLFLRTEYSVLYSELRPADASAIVAELDERGVGYQLRDGGATIAVAADRAAEARLAIAGSDVAARGAVGFELFNESDMGLTDFAQRINYQRALQGELARTIMMMGDIESARVHLALPERSLFRGTRTRTSAAVTITSQRGRTVEAARVAGIQRLVAAAVPDLDLGDVVVLDNVGRLISRTEAVEAYLPPELEENAAVQHYFRGRARAAIENVLPGLAFDLRVSVLPQQEAARQEPWSSEPAMPPSETETAPDASVRRNFRLRLVLLTPAALVPAERELAKNAVAGSVDLDEAAGDALVFTVAPLGSGAAPPVAAGLPEEDAGFAPARRIVPSGWRGSWWFLPAALAVLAGIAIFLRSRSSALSVPEREAFIVRIREQIRLVEEGGDARA